MHSQYSGVDLCTHRIGFPPKTEISNDTNSRDMIINSVVAIAAMRVVVLKDGFIMLLGFRLVMYSRFEVLSFPPSSAWH